LLYIYLLSILSCHLSIPDGNKASTLFFNPAVLSTYQCLPGVCCIVPECCFTDPASPVAGLVKYFRNGVKRRQMRYCPILGVRWFSRKSSHDFSVKFRRVCEVNPIIRTALPLFLFFRETIFFDWALLEFP